jgi:hypothetical protein
MANKVPWFDVDVGGLAETVARRNKAFVAWELFQNCVDEGAKLITITADPVPNRPLVEITVTDDVPEGFRDLRDAYTLFKRSYKKGDPDKAGKFDIGEKLVIAACEEASIVTTTGGVAFDNRGRTVLKDKREKGSQFWGMVKMTRDEYKEFVVGVSMLIAPPGCAVTFNGEPLKPHKLVSTFSATLLTEWADETGVLKRNPRKTTVEVYETLANETAHIYELGVPVVDTGDRFHYLVKQRVPVSMDRDNVPPSYLTNLRTLCLNETKHLLSKEEAAKPWVSDGLGNKLVSVDTVKDIVEKRTDEKIENIVSFDPSDPEANNKAIANGKRILYGGALPGEAWDKLRGASLVQGAGRLFPTKPEAFIKCSPVEPDTKGQELVVRWYKHWGEKLLGFKVKVRMIHEPAVTNYASWDNISNTLTLNRGNLGTKFFENGIDEKVIALGLHEFAHAMPGGDNHLSEAYYDGICTLGARLALKGNCENWFEE